MSAWVDDRPAGLFEREPELERVARLLDRARRRTGGVAIVEGPAGIGKTELLAVVGARAAVGDRGVLRARGSEFESEVAFGVARQLFEPMLRSASSAERRRLLAGVGRVGAIALGVEPGQALPDPFAAIHGLYWLLANQAERAPVVVLIDDLQWVDAPSLAWLGYLARRAADLAVLLVLGLRSGRLLDQRSEVQRLVTGEGVQRILLSPLSPLAVAAMTRAQLDAEADERFCSTCSELTGGNPLFVRELLAAARGEGLSARDESVARLQLIAPAAVGVSVLARLGRMGGQAVALARAVAVLGAGAEVAVAAELAGLDPVTGELIADQLAAAQILAPTRPLEFFHPLLESAVREDMAPGARRVAHRRAADLLDDHHDQSLARVAAHLLACGAAGDRWVVGRLVDAAREALDRGAPEIAATYVCRALAEPPMEPERAALLLLLGTAEWRAGQSDAIAHLEQAIAAAGADFPTLIAACGLSARAHMVNDRAERAVEALERAREAVAGVDGPLALAFEAGMVMVGMMDGRTAPNALARAETLRSRLRALAEPPVQLLVMLAHYAVRAQRWSEARELTDRVLACKPYPPPLEECNVLIATLAFIERYDAVQTLCNDLLAAARSRGAMHEMVGIVWARASASAERGALADAEADARWALERADGIHRLHAATDLAGVLLERDLLDDAEQALEELGDPCSSLFTGLTTFLITRGRLRSAQGRLHDALEDFLQAGRRCEPLGLITLAALPWRGEAALAHAALGNRGEARRLAGEQLALARGFGGPRTLGMSLRARGLVEDGNDGLELLAEAVDTLTRSQSPLELARARADFGAALRRSGRPATARTELAGALDLAHHLGAWRIAARARSELIVAGAKPRRDAITGRDALTASELRVARLAADGLSNREIAQTLFITTKTAKAHLGRIYRKLSISRRGQLGGALAQQVRDSGEVAQADTTRIS